MPTLSMAPRLWCSVAYSVDMPIVAAGNTAALYGDLGGYWLAVSSQFSARILNEVAYPNIRLAVHFRQGGRLQESWKLAGIVVKS